MLQRKSALRKDRTAMVWKRQGSSINGTGKTGQLHVKE